MESHNFSPDANRFRRQPPLKKFLPATSRFSNPAADFWKKAYEKLLHDKQVEATKPLTIINFLYNQREKTFEENNLELQNAKQILRSELSRKQVIIEENDANDHDDDINHGNNICVFCGIILKDKSDIQNHFEKFGQDKHHKIQITRHKFIQVNFQDTGVDEILDWKTFEKRNEYKVETILGSLKDVISINPNFIEVIEAYAKVCVEDQMKSSDEVLITLLGELEGNGWDDSKSFMETLPLRLPATGSKNNEFMSNWLSQNSFVFHDLNENQEHINLLAKIIRKLLLHVHETI